MLRQSCMWKHHPLLFSGPPPSVIPSPFIYLTQLGQLKPPQAADTTMYKITCNEQRNQLGTTLKLLYILQHQAVAHSGSYNGHFHSFRLALITSIHHTHQRHQSDDNHQLEVLHTHGSGQVATRGLKCDRLNAVQSDIKYQRWLAFNIQPQPFFLLHATITWKTVLNSQSRPDCPFCQSAIQVFLLSEQLNLEKKRKKVNRQHSGIKFISRHKTQEL